MAEEKDTVRVVTAEAQALEIASVMVQRVFAFSVAVPGRNPVPGRFFENLQGEGDEALKTRLREMADLIGDMKRRMLE